MGIGVKKEWHDVFDFMVIPSQFAPWKSPHWSSRDIRNEHSIFVDISHNYPGQLEGERGEAPCYRDPGLETEPPKSREIISKEGVPF